MSRIFLPHDYQGVGIDHLQEHLRSALWAPVGAGKCGIVLSALTELAMVEEVFPALVIGTVRIANGVWKQECAKWENFNHLKVSIITGDVDSRRTALRRKAHIYTTNYEQLMWLVDVLGNDWPFKTIVADENTKLRSFRTRQGSKRAGALGKKAFNSDRFIGLTGTPTPKGLVDLWGPSWFLDRGERLGRTFSAFESRWFTRGYDGFSLKPASHAQREIEERLGDICLTIDGLPVEEPIHNAVWVDLPPAARKLYDAMEKEMFAEIGAHGVEALNAASKTVKCQQIASGAIITGDKTWEQVHEAKLEALDDIIEESAGAPVLLAYQFRADLARLQKRYPQARVLDTKAKTIDEWNDGNIPILIVHPASCAHGLNLARGGNILVLLTPDWDLELFLQMIGRIAPLRQKQEGLDRPVFVHSILARRTIDELVVERRETKASVQTILLEAFKRRSV